MSLFDRVRDVSTTTGTGNLTLSGTAPTGFRTFGSVFSNNDRVYYCIAHQSANEWETGFGTYLTSGPALARTVVLASSNAGAAVNFSAGTKDVFVTPPATVFGDRLPEISITGTATATIDRMHVCSGTAADYTVTLPAAANNAGRRLWFRMGTALTRFVTLDGNGSETIDGATTRVMWAGETAELLCDGSNWFKVAGRTIPMVCRLRLSSATQSIANATVTTITLNQTDVDNTGWMADLASNRLVIRRPANYRVFAKVVYDDLGANASRLIVTVSRSATPATTVLQGEMSGLSGGYPQPNIADIQVGVAGEGWILRTFHNRGASQNVFGSTAADACFLLFEESPAW